MALNKHWETQAYRFVRLFFIALFSAGVLAPGGFDSKLLASAAVAAAETAWRQLHPASPAPPGE